MIARTYISFFANLTTSVFSIKMTDWKWNFLPLLWITVPRQINICAEKCDPCLQGSPKLFQFHLKRIKFAAKKLFYITVTYLIASFLRHIYLIFGLIRHRRMLSLTVELSLINKHCLFILKIGELSLKERCLFLESLC